MPMLPASEEILTTRAPMALFFSRGRNALSTRIGPTAPTLTAGATRSRSKSGSSFIVSAEAVVALLMIRSRLSVNFEHSAAAALTDAVEAMSIFRIWSTPGYSFFRPSSASEGRRTLANTRSPFSR